MKKKYRLYAMKTTQESIEIAAKERFSRINASYTLLYKRGKGPEHSLEIKGKHLDKLTAAEFDWLMDCNTLLILEAAEEREKEVCSAVSGRIAALERELEKQRAKEVGNAESE